MIEEIYCMVTKTLNDWVRKIYWKLVQLFLDNAGSFDIMFSCYLWKSPCIGSNYHHYSWLVLELWNIRNVLIKNEFMFLQLITCRSHTNGHCFYCIIFVTHRSFRAEPFSCCLEDHFLGRYDHNRRINLG